MYDHFLFFLFVACRFEFWTHNNKTHRNLSTILYFPLCAGDKFGTYKSWNKNILKECVSYNTFFLWRYKVARGIFVKIYVICIFDHMSPASNRGEKRIWNPIGYFIFLYEFQNVSKIMPAFVHCMSIWLRHGASVSSSCCHLSTSGYLAFWTHISYLLGLSLTQYIGQDWSNHR